MLHRVALFRFLTALAVGAMVGFVGAGCGDDNNNAQNDAGQHDVAQDVPAQDDVAAQHDGQADTVIPSGQIVVAQVIPQKVSAQIPDVKIPFVIASWNMPSVLDQPVDSLWVPGAVDPLGCSAARYKFSDGKIPTTSSYNAGDVTISGYTGGKVLTNFPGPLPDGGLAALPDFPSQISCTRAEVLHGDAGTGHFAYTCSGNPAALYAAPNTGFMTAGDQLTVGVTGGEVPAFTLSGTNASKVEAMVNPEINLFGYPQYIADAGTLTVPYNCGPETVADAGVQPCGPATVIVIYILSSDDFPPAYPLKDADPKNEFGMIQCSLLTLGASTRSFTITKEMLDVAFPSTLKWTTLKFAMVHLSLNTFANGGTTSVASGQGQIGMVVNPSVPDAGWY
jgi:hypothetical protein